MVRTKVKPKTQAPTLEKGEKEDIRLKESEGGTRENPRDIEGHMRPRTRTTEIARIMMTQGGKWPSTARRRRNCMSSTKVKTKAAAALAARHVTDSGT